MAYIKQVEAIERTLTLRRRRLEEQDKTRGGRDKMTDRQRALLEHGTRAWVEEILALPEGWEYDPGVAWDEIGIDMLVVDEAASFKNLYLPSRARTAASRSSWEGAATDRTARGSSTSAPPWSVVKPAVLGSSCSPPPPPRIRRSSSTT
ncbi:MAG: hypothetical protein IPK80_14955 [Nannocystis sp.]|nr:hypothetical protein [Nannocystis sp.]